MQEIVFVYFSEKHLNVINSMTQQEIEASVKERLGNTSLSDRTISEYFALNLPPEGKDPDDAYFTKHVSVLKSLGGNLSHDVAAAVDDFKKKYQPQPKGNDDAQKEPKPDDDKKQQGEGGGNESGELIKSLRDKISQIEKRFNEEDAKNKKQETEKVVKAKMKELGADDDYVLSKTLQVADLSGDNADDIAKNLMKAYDKEYKLCRGKGARPHAGVSIQGNGGDSSIDEFFKKKAAKEHWKTAPAK